MTEIQREVLKNLFTVGNICRFVPDKRVGKRLNLLAIAFASAFFLSLFGSSQTVAAPPTPTATTTSGSQGDCQVFIYPTPIKTNINNQIPDSATIVSFRNKGLTTTQKLVIFALYDDSGSEELLRANNAYKFEARHSDKQLTGDFYIAAVNPTGTVKLHNEVVLNLPDETLVTKYANIKPQDSLFYSDRLANALDNVIACRQKENGNDNRSKQEQSNKNIFEYLTSLSVFASPFVLTYFWQKHRKGKSRNERKEEVERLDAAIEDMDEPLYKTRKIISWAAYTTIPTIFTLTTLGWITDAVGILTTSVITSIIGFGVALLQISEVQSKLKKHRHKS